MTDQRYRTAVHESGHCIVVWAMGGEVEFTTLDEDDNGTTSMQVRAGNSDADWFTAWFGGEAAEVAVLRVAVGGDDEHSASDRTAIETHAAEVSSRISTEPIVEMMLNAQRRAMRLAHAHARDIAALARELARVGTLQGDDLNRFRPAPRDFGPMH